VCHGLYLIIEANSRKKCLIDFSSPDNLVTCSIVSRSEAAPVESDNKVGRRGVQAVRITERCAPRLRAIGKARSFSSYHLRGPARRCRKARSSLLLQIRLLTDDRRGLCAPLATLCAGSGP